METQNNINNTSEERIHMLEEQVKLLTSQVNSLTDKVNLLLAKETNFGPNPITPPYIAKDPIRNPYISWNESDVLIAKNIYGDNIIKDHITGKLVQTTHGL